jgi:hypothetical protein
MNYHTALKAILVATLLTVVGCDYFDPVSDLISEERGTDQKPPQPVPPAATTIVVDTDSLEATLVSGKSDRYSFAAESGTSYLIQTFGYASVRLRLYAADGLTLLGSDDGSGYGSNPLLSLNCSASGTYFFTVSSIFGGTGAYSVKVTSVVADSYEPNNSISTATLIQPDSQAQKHILTNSDRDYFVFPAIAGKMYKIKKTGSISTSMTLYSTTGTTSISSTSSDSLVWTCSTSGSYYCSISGYSSYDIGPYTIEIFVTLPVGSDRYEPDGSIELATPIKPDSGSQSHGLTGGEYDYYSFAAQAGRTYTIAVSTSYYSTSLRLYATNGTSTLTSSSSSQLPWTCISSGTYYFSVYNSYSSYTGFNYTIAVTSVAAANVDSYEPDDSVSRATVIKPDSGAQSHGLHVSDYDYFSFSAVSGKSYTITSSGTYSTYIRLYGIGGTSLLTSSSGSPLTWSCTSSGTYYFSISSYSSSYSFAYTVSVASGLAPGYDSYEPDSVFGLATPIVADYGSQAHGLTVGDRDFYSLAATAGKTYGITLTGSYYPYIYIYGTDGKTIIKSVSSTLQTSWACSKSGTYFFEVRSTSSSATGYNYTVNVTSVATIGYDTYEPDDSVRFATPIVADSAAQPHGISVGDVDYYRFSADAGKAYTLFSNNSSSTTINLYAENGTTVLKNTTNGSLIWNCISKGAYYFAVRGYSSTTATTYSMALTSAPLLGFDLYEPDSSISLAKTIIPDSAAQSHGLYVGDADYFKFTGIAGTTYIIQTTGTISTAVRLFGSDGATVLASSSGGNIIWSVKTSGVYYFDVRPNLTTASGTYSVTVEVSK